MNFEVSAIGRNVTYQWYYKRPNSTWKKTTKEGSKTAVLPITAGTVNNGTSYRCVITDEEGNQITSSAARLTLDNVIPLQVTVLPNAVAALIIPLSYFNRAVIASF